MRKANVTLLVSLGVVATFIGGTALGYATTEPEVIEKTTTVTETVEVTPQSCIVALDSVASALESAAGYAALLPDAASAGFSRSPSDLDIVTGKIADITDEIAITREGMGDSALECRAGVK